MQITYSEFICLWSLFNISTASVLVHFLAVSFVLCSVLFNFRMF